MNPRTLGNFVPSHGPSSGSGRGGMRTPFGRVTLSGKTGEIKFVALSDLVALNGSGMNVLAQTIGASVDVAVTLAPPDLATNPSQTGLWVNSTAVAPGAIVQLPFMGSALKVSFTADAIIYLMVV